MSSDVDWVVTTWANVKGSRGYGSDLCRYICSSVCVSYIPLICYIWSCQGRIIDNINVLFIIWISGSVLYNSVLYGDFGEKYSARWVV